MTYEMCYCPGVFVEAQLVLGNESPSITWFDGRRNCQAELGDWLLTFDDDSQQVWPRKIFHLFWKEVTSTSDRG